MRGRSLGILATVVAVLVLAVPAFGEVIPFAGALIDASAVPTLPAVGSVVNPPGNSPVPEAYGTSLWSVYNGTPCDTTDRAVAGTPRPALDNCQAVTVPGAAGTVYVGFPIHIPTGAVVQYFRIYFNQTVITDQIGAGFWKADQWGVTTVVQGMGPTPTTAGDSSQQWGPISEVIDNQPEGGYVYYFLASVKNTSKVYKMMLYYKLQVSPAPALATFADVPTDYWAFRHVEALSASGITTGCGTNPLIYCPERTITRAEMAVFLAKALGLAYQY